MIRTPLYMAVGMAPDPTIKIFGFLGSSEVLRQEKLVAGICAVGEEFIDL